MKVNTNVSEVKALLNNVKGVKNPHLQTDAATIERLVSYCTEKAILSGNVHTSDGMVEYYRQGFFSGVRYCDTITYIL